MFKNKFDLIMANMRLKKVFDYAQPDGRIVRLSVVEVDKEKTRYISVTGLPN